MSMMLNGARFAVATNVAAAVAISAITNAAPPNATAAVAPTVGDILLIQSGWSGLNEIVARAANVVGSAFDLEGYDTTDAFLYPAGEGVGAYLAASGWVNLPKIHDIQPSGGEPNFSSPRQYVDDPAGNQVQVPTGKSPRSTTYMMDYQPTLAHFAAMQVLDRKKTLTIMRESLTNGDIIYYPGYLAFDKEPTKALNEFISNRLTFSQSAPSVRYAAP